MKDIFKEFEKLYIKMYTVIEIQLVLLIATAYILTQMK